MRYVRAEKDKIDLMARLILLHIKGNLSKFDHTQINLKSYENYLIPNSILHFD